MSPRPLHLLAVLALLLTASLTPAASASAQAAPFCQPDQTPSFNFGFAALKQMLGASMGDPIECEHPNADNGDTLQRTTTGLAFYRQSTNTPTFTDGWNHWGLAPAGPVAWTGPQVDPPTAAALQAGLPCLTVRGTCLAADPALAPTLTLLAGTQSAAPLLAIAARAGVSVRLGETPEDVLGFFQPGAAEIVLTNALRAYPTIDAAAVLAHELQHVADLSTGGAAFATERGCFLTEAHAFQTQSATWLELEGGQLKPAANDVEAELNAIAEAIATDPAGFLSHLQTIYHHECSGA